VSIAKNALKAQKDALNVKNSSKEAYSSFDQIDGSHSFKTAVPNGFIDYPARTRHGGEVFFFNFSLAREMGLISDDHPDELTPKLKEKILHTFSIVIINEYDVQNKTPIDPKDVRPNSFMATRYLQLQHPNKQGKTSGDGRGIWNGEFKHKGTTWDVTSSGTGATRLSPAHAQTKQFFKTGDKVVGYGNGYNCTNDGMSAALMSDIFHRNGIETERTLAIISFEGGVSINVRAGKNLFRPAHFFHQSKQKNYHGLKASVDFFIERQIQNEEVGFEKPQRTQNARYQHFAETMALTFSRIAAQFEAEYIFCWLDWDGDNILANGGIIDYGSVRQFGLYHCEYRYDDVDRMSTNIPEQKNKARYIVQNFAQIRDFLNTGKKRNIRKFRKDPLLKLFDQNFTRVLHEHLLKKIGLNHKETDYILQSSPRLVRKLKKSHSYFEKTKSARGIYKTQDGVTADAVFCMKDIHRELPKLFLKDQNPIEAEAFVEIIKSSYAKKRDLKINGYRREEVRRFQHYYLKIVKEISAHFHQGDLKKTLLEMTMRASYVNRPDRITGDSVLHLTTSLIRNHYRLTFEQKMQVFESLVKHQSDHVAPGTPKAHTKTGKIVLRNLKAIYDYREGF
jgi:uncharacterized protein YdiU (UPF0061 family)